jgi:hypothetical protein
MESNNLTLPLPKFLTQYALMRFLLCLLLASGLAFNAGAQGTKIEITTCKAIGNEGSANIYEVRFKVISGHIDGTGKDLPLALPLPNGTKAFATLNAYDDVSAGKSSPSTAMLKVFGHPAQTGKSLVSHDLAIVKTPPDRSFAFNSNMAFLDVDPQVFFGSIHSIKGFASVGDEIAYTNSRGQQGRGKILDFEVEGGLKTNLVFEGIPDGIITIKVLALNQVDFSESKVIPASAAASTPLTTSPASNASKVAAHKIKTIPLNITLENKELKITIHNLIKFNPDSTDRTLDVFPVDYSLDYYIVDASFENKTANPLDIGDYVLRLNFFSPDGKSADDFLRLFKAKKNSNDSAQRDADKIDTNIFGGTSKIRMASVMVKYEMTIPDYDQKYKDTTNALYKPIASGQKIRSINAGILGVPPSYKIEGLGTWNGTFLDKKNLIFVPIKL